MEAQLSCHTLQSIIYFLLVLPVLTARSGNSMLQGGNKLDAVQRSPGWHACNEAGSSQKQKK